MQSMTRVTQCTAKFRAIIQLENSRGIEFRDGLYIHTLWKLRNSISGETLRISTFERRRIGLEVITLFIIRTTYPSIRLMKFTSIDSRTCLIQSLSTVGSSIDFWGVEGWRFSQQQLKWSVANFRPDVVYSPSLQAHSEGSSCQRSSGMFESTFSLQTSTASVLVLYNLSYPC